MLRHDFQEALYHPKQDGRNWVRVSEHSQAIASRRALSLSMLALSVSKGQVRLCQAHNARDVVG